MTTIKLKQNNILQAFILLCSCFMYNMVNATIVSNPNQASPIIVTKGFAPATVNVRLTFTTSGNGTTTFTLPTGLKYVPGSIVDNNPVTDFAETNITNLSAPVFSFSDAINGQAVIISVQVQAECAAVVGTNNINVTGTVLPSDNFSGTISVSVNAPAITITGHAPITFTRGQTGITANITITNGAAGPLDTVLF